MVVLTGQCHCGAVRAALETAREPAAISVRACQCGFCRRHGAATASDPTGRLRLEVRRPLKRYRFGAGSIDMLLCGGCGVYVAAVLETDHGLLATVNVAGLAMAPLDAATPAPVDYDGESAAARRERRLAAWTPVTIAEISP
jgi:hypothetical protein